MYLINVGGRFIVQKIYYICSYNNPEVINENRYYPLSGAAKIDSIIDSFQRIKKKIEIISISMVHNDQLGKSHYVELGNNVYLKLFKSYGRKNIIVRFMDSIQFYIRFVMYLLMNIKKEDTVVVYHSLAYYKIIPVLKKIIGFKLILEVEEIYSDVLENDKYRSAEFNIINLADALIFPSYELESICNINRKPYVVIHGTYDIHDGICMRGDKNRDFIHIVYAGTLDIRKGCIETIKMAALLPKQYRVSILGTDRPENFDVLNKLIENVNTRGGAKVKLLGKKTGIEYNKFLQSCDIGMCTQDPNASFTETSFPSKILSYLANGLRVVAVDIPAIRNSDVADILYFYKKQTPEDIANCIKSIDMDSFYDSRSMIKDLKKKFIINISHLLDELEKG